MIWGEIINSVRKIHLDLASDYGLDPALFTRDIELSSMGVPYPRSLDDFEEWDEFSLPRELQDLLPLHPVERALIEGPLLPIHLIEFQSPEEIHSLYRSILLLERDWLEKTRTSTPENLKFIESQCHAWALRMTVRAGFRKLSPTKESET